MGLVWELILQEAHTPAGARQVGLGSGAQLGTLVRTVYSVPCEQLPGTWPRGTCGSSYHFTWPCNVSLPPFLPLHPTLAFDSD